MVHVPIEKKSHFCLPVICCLLWVTSYSQSSYWQQKLNYTIDVSLDDNLHTLDGFMKLEYENHSPDTLHYIWFHIWPNAYKNDKTALSDQLLENGNTDFYFSEEDQKGYINRLDFKVNGITADIEDHPSHIDIIRLIPPQPFGAGKQSRHHYSFPCTIACHLLPLWT
ncbi:MAG: hypothetical protein NVV59_11820 [Chitinophagaceae bacterium]|nr:hypothetical protein [Chitinophagaceae bacterium]